MRVHCFVAPPAAANAAVELADAARAEPRGAVLWLTLLLALLLALLLLLLLAGLLLLLLLLALHARLVVLQRGVEVCKTR